MPTKNSAPLSKVDYDRMSLASELYESGKILIDQLLNKEFRDNLSVKDCEKLIDIAVDNMSKSSLLVITFNKYIKNVTSFEKFTIYPNMLTIVEEDTIND